MKKLAIVAYTAKTIIVRVYTTNSNEEAQTVLGFAQKIQASGKAQTEVRNVTNNLMQVVDDLRAVAGHDNVVTEFVS